jgi:hypothetical protein
MMSQPPKRNLKLVCLAILGLGTHESTAFGTAASSLLPNTLVFIAFWGWLIMLEEVASFHSESCVFISSKAQSSQTH